MDKIAIRNPDFCQKKKQTPHPNCVYLLYIYVFFFFKVLYINVIER